MDFTGKVVIVTGGAQGIGRATAVALAARGARVTVVDRDIQGGGETLRLIAEAGGNGQFRQADVSRSEDVRDYVEAAVAHGGRSTASSTMPGSRERSRRSTRSTRQASIRSSPSILRARS
jgi:NAD(P)-dependent dehydrogenase (short-subunit alcohol dehydrogenase family)